VGRARRAEASACDKAVQQPLTRHLGAGTPATDLAATPHSPCGSRHAGDRSCINHPPAMWEPACRRQVLQQPPTRHAGAGTPATDLAATPHPPCGSRHAGDRSCSSHPPAMFEPACRRQVLQQPPTRHVGAGMPATGTSRLARPFPRRHRQPSLPCQLPQRTTPRAAIHSRSAHAGLPLPGFGRNTLTPRPAPQSGLECGPSRGLRDTPDDPSRRP